jgi:hypothetical protein
LGAELGARSLQPVMQLTKQMLAIIQSRLLMLMAFDSPQWLARQVYAMRSPVN